MRTYQYCVMTTGCIPPKAPVAERASAHVEDAVNSRLVPPAAQDSVSARDAIVIGSSSSDSDSDATGSGSYLSDSDSCVASPVSYLSSSSSSESEADDEGDSVSVPRAKAGPSFNLPMNQAAAQAHAARKARYSPLSPPPDPNAIPSPASPELEIATPESLLVPKAPVHANFALATKKRLSLDKPRKKAQERTPPTNPAAVEIRERFVWRLKVQTTGVKETFETIAEGQYFQTAQSECITDLELLMEKFFEFLNTEEFGGEHYPGDPDYEQLKTEYFSRCCYWKCQFWMEQFKRYAGVCPGFKERCKSKQRHIFRFANQLHANPRWFRDADPRWIELWDYIHNKLIFRSGLDDAEGIHVSLRTWTYGY